MRGWQQFPVVAAAGVVLLLLAWRAGRVSPSPPQQPPAEPAPATQPIAPADPESPPTERHLLITRLEIGRPPFAWEPPDANPLRRRVYSFVTDSPSECRVRAEARLTGGDGASTAAHRLRWEIVPPEGFRLPADATLTGPAIDVVLHRPRPVAGAGPMTITVRVQVEGEPIADHAIATQDELDQLRQEYVDLSREGVPERSAFLDEVAFTEKYGRRFPMLPFSRLNTSQNRAAGGRPYRWILITEALLECLARLHRTVDRPLQLTSVYRNPLKQEIVNEPVDESHHQYGRAADIYVWPNWASPRDGRTVANAADWLLLANAAWRAGAHWLEPMTLTHVNTDHCHLHLDVRESGQRSQPVGVGGVVRSRTGRPVVGARVDLAGMTTVTGAGGRFFLQHLLTPGEYLLVVTLPNGRTLTHRISLLAQRVSRVVVQEPGGAIRQGEGRVGTRRPSNVR